MVFFLFFFLHGERLRNASGSPQMEGRSAAQLLVEASSMNKMEPGACLSDVQMLLSS